MKKIILILALVMLSVTTYGQEFNKWALSGEFGNQMVGDKTAVTVDEFNHFGLGLRYNINEIVGVGLTGGYDFTSLSEELKSGSFGPEYDFEYGRVNLEGYINAFKAVDLYSKRWTVLFHGGTGLSFIKSDGMRYDYENIRDGESYNEFNNKETVVNIRGGGTLLYKISKRLAAYADISTTSNINQTNKFDGSGRITNTGMSSNVTNISVGLTAYLGKKNKEHADWYVKEPIVPIIKNVSEVTEVHNTYPTIEITEEEFNTYISNYLARQPISEFVFFAHDKDVLNDDDNAALLSAYKVYTQLEKNPTWNLTIRGFASPTNSSLDYNKKLSERRTNTLKNKFIKMGIDSSRIKVYSFGKDEKRSDIMVHDIARRVELLITKK
jgi:outer membrane protein OmpA-like peptidoglycan-associated protein